MKIVVFYMELYFTDYFKVSTKTLEKYGALNVSLRADIPLFIDPFLLFNSKKKEYQELHDNIIGYLKFLREKSLSGKVDNGALKAWYMFQEVKETWLGFSEGTNKGSGLGMEFARVLNENLSRVFKEFGDEKVTKGSHLEKLCLIKEGVGKDCISDFTTNLIKEFLLKYTEEFTKKYVPESLTGEFRIRRVRFNYKTETWEDDQFTLPKLKNNFVLLTPKDLLTKDETWINRKDFIREFENIPDSIPDDQLRFQINNYFNSQLKNDPNKEATSSEKSAAALNTLQEYPELIDYFIKYKEDNGDQAGKNSDEKVIFSQSIFIENIKKLRNDLQKQGFYDEPTINSFEEARKRIDLLKKWIEDNDGYKIFYDKKGNPVKSEDDLQLMFKLACANSVFDTNREPNNGRGPVDYAVSFGAKDKTLIEFKLARNTKLRKNLINQVEIYKRANATEKAFKVIVFFSEEEMFRVNKILSEEKLELEANIILIDARRDNKPSASNA